MPAHVNRVVVCLEICIMRSYSSVPPSTAILPSIQAQPAPTLAGPIAELLTQLLQGGQQAPPPPTFPDHRDAVEPWVRSIESGTFSGRPFSPHTVANYRRYVDYFLDTYGPITIASLEHELASTPVHMFGRRSKFHRAIACFAKFLDRHHSLGDPHFMERCRQLKPIRHLPPKRTTLNEAELNLVFAAADSPINYVLLKLLASTGLRAAECCALNRGDIDLEQGILIVQCGKGGKRRRVGLSNEVITLLAEHMKKQPGTDDSPLFYGRFGERLRRDGLLNRLRRIGKLAGVHTTPHALRRAFVTINAHKGRPLVMLQVACGHSDIKTTRSYCQTTEDDVIEAMKEW